MKGLGYQVLKGRGIAFIDDKKVRTKGSEVGFSLMKIEKILHLKEEISAKERIYEEQKNRSDTPKTLDLLLSPPPGEIYDNPPPTPRKKKKQKKPQQHI